MLHLFRGAVAAPTIVAAVLPASRSVSVGTPATAFATIINTGPDTATSCRIVPAMAHANPYHLHVSGDGSSHQCGDRYAERAYRHCEWNGATTVFT